MVIKRDKEFKFDVIEHVNIVDSRIWILYISKLPDI